MGLTDADLFYLFPYSMFQGQDFGALLAPLLAGGANGGGLQVT